MGLFNRKHRNAPEDAGLLDFNLPFAFPGDEEDDDVTPIGKRQVQSTYALTAEEVSRAQAGDRPAHATDEIPMQAEQQNLHAAGELLYQRMMQDRRQTQSKAAEAPPEKSAETVPPILVAPPEPTEPEMPEPPAQIEPPVKVEPPVKAETPAAPAKPEPPKEPEAPAKMEAPQQPEAQKRPEAPEKSESPKQAEPQKQPEPPKQAEAPAKAEAAKQPEPAARKSLLDLCKPFLTDENGRTAGAETPDYILESVDDIILSVERKAAENVAKRYGVTLKIDPAASRPTASAAKSDAPQPTRPAAKPNAERRTPSRPGEAGRAGTPLAPNRMVSSAAAKRQILQNRAQARPAARTPEEIPMRRVTPSANAVREAVRENPTRDDRPLTPKRETEAPQRPAARPTPTNDARPAAGQQSTRQFRPAEKADPVDISSGKKYIDVHAADLPPAPEEVMPRKSAPSSRLQAKNTDAALPQAPRRTPEREAKSQPAPPALPREFEADYTSYADAKPIRHTLFTQKRRAVFRLLPTLLLTAAMIVCSLPVVSNACDGWLHAKGVVPFALLLLLALLHLDVWKGFAALLPGRQNADLPVAVGLLGALIHETSLLFLQPENALSFLAPAAAFCLLCRDVGRLMQASVVLENFKQIATPQEKTAFFAIDDRPVTYAMTHDSIPGEALVASGRRTTQILDFLRRSFAPGPLETKNRAVALLALIAGVVIALLAGLRGGISAVLPAFGAALCLAAPPTALLTGALPVKLAADRLGRYGAMLAGSAAAAEVEQVNAAAFTVQELFPAGSVRLLNMKILGTAVSDETLAQAAAVAQGIGSPLTDLFLRIVDTRADAALPKADSVKYEDRLGISGWVGERRLFIGNRTLLEAHGIAAPSVELDHKILHNGCFPVYLACDGKAQALLIVKYEARPDVTYELCRLCNAGVTVLVNNCDPNVTDEMICDYFGLYADCVKVMNSAASDMHLQATRPVEQLSAPAAYQSGSAAAPAAIINAAIRVRRAGTVMTALHIVCLCLALALYAYLCFSGIPLTLPMLGGYWLAALLIACLVPCLNRP